MKKILAALLCALLCLVPAVQAEFIRRFREKHGGRLLCDDLLAAADEAQVPHKVNCDGCVADAVAIIDELGI